MPCCRRVHENKVNYMKKRLKNLKEKKRNPFWSRTHDHKISKPHITSQLFPAYLLQFSQIPINTLFRQFNSLFANTEMYEAINKLHNYRIIHANFIHEYGVDFHEL